MPRYGYLRLLIWSLIKKKHCSSVIRTTCRIIILLNGIFSPILECVGPENNSALGISNIPENVALPDSPSSETENDSPDINKFKKTILYTKKEHKRILKETFFELNRSQLILENSDSFINKKKYINHTKLSVFDFLSNKNIFIKFRSSILNIIKYKLNTYKSIELNPTYSNLNELTNSEVVFSNKINKFLHIYPDCKYFIRES